MELNRQAFNSLLNEGKAAFAAGDPSDACPYDRNGPVEDKFGYRYWTRGWVMARSAAEAAQPEPADAPV
ncbi:hypothetical protein ACIBAC_00280 [Streptomyces sp. NPDC051362]|uniref:hypothetical protein n=1 Tax=Streptomyces sp. NPDC051362 TaxID=3365651 RepID=UPI00379EEA53